MADVNTVKTVEHNYKAGLVEAVKAAGQMMIDAAEDIVGTTSCTSGLNVAIEFDPWMRSIPEMTITRRHLPDQHVVKVILDKFEGKNDPK